MLLPCYYNVITKKFGKWNVLELNMREKCSWVKHELNKSLYT
jgi:hypothetical protein